MKITVIGPGRWGSFIAWYLDSIGKDITLYGRENSIHMRELLQTRGNGLLTLPESVKLSTDISCAANSDIICISVDSQSLRLLLRELAGAGAAEKTIVLCMKGLEISSGERLSQVAGEELPLSKIAVWLGPGHVQEFCRGIPNCMVIDSADEATKNMLVDSFSSKLIRFYYGSDLIGNEIGAAAKNVIGIAAGMLDGLSRSSLKGALMARGAREVARLIGAMGGNEFSAYGLCHLGDYEATVFSKYSHNRMYGEKVVKGETYSELAEGFYTVRAMMSLGKKYGVDLPITEAVFRVLYEKANPKDALSSLFERTLKEEFV